MMKMGEKITQRRKEIGMTQVELAEKMYVTRQTVSRWENNAVLPDLEKIPQLATLLGVTCDWLLTDSEGLSEPAEPVSPETTMQSAQPSRLLSGLIGKSVQFSFYDDAEDFDPISNDCVVLSFDGTWFRVQGISKERKDKKNKKGESVSAEKLISLASVLSVKILGKAVES